MLESLRASTEYISLRSRFVADGGLNRLGELSVLRDGRCGVCGGDGAGLLNISRTSRGLSGQMPVFAQPDLMISSGKAFSKTDQKRRKKSCFLIAVKPSVSRISCLSYVERALMTKIVDVFVMASAWETAVSAMSSNTLKPAA